MLIIKLLTIKNYFKHTLKDFLIYCGMNVYFYSPVKAAVTSNQFKPCIIDQNVMAFDFKPNFYAQLDFGDCFLPSSVYFNPNFSKNMSIIDLYAGFLVFPKLVKAYNLPYKILDRRSIVCSQIEIFVTVYQKGGVYLRLDGFSQSNVLELPFIPKTLELANLGGNLFIIKATNKLCFFAIVSALDLSILLSDLCDNVLHDNKLTTIKIYKGISTHVKTTNYGFDGKFFVTDTSFNSSCDTPLLDAVLPLAFLEEVRLGVDYRHYLSDTLKNDSHLLREFLGNFSFALPPILKGHRDNFLIVSDSVKFVKIQVENGLVLDLSAEPFPF